MLTVKDLKQRSNAIFSLTSFYYGVTYPVIVCNSLAAYRGTIPDKMLHLPVQHLPQAGCDHLLFQLLCNFAILKRTLFPTDEDVTYLTVT